MSGPTELAEESRRRRSRFDRARNLDRARGFDGARHVHRERNEKYRWHHKCHGTDCGRFVTLAAIHRAIIHAGCLCGHVVSAIFVRSRSRCRGFRVCRGIAFVVMLGDVAETLSAARHQRRRKRSRGQRRIQHRNRQQTSQRAKHSCSIVALAAQGRPENRSSIIVHSSR